jgi:hypothetical protein
MKYISEKQETGRKGKEREAVCEREEKRGKR